MVECDWINQQKGVELQPGLEQEAATSFENGVTVIMDDQLWTHGS